ncbi:MAG TPA: heavy metal-associated domain-containing protein [Stenomitos sp.]
MVTLSVTGMTCQNCVKHVTHALQGVPGAEQVSVDLASGTAQVGGSPDVQALIAAVEEEGYEATVR